ncbi:MAG: hypothetical protein OER93_05670 [Thermoleophilia bacterium]|nr:hypothetical protein [Thermoleophilia bacterium]
MSLGFAFLALLVAALGYFFLLKPLNAETADAKDETAQLEQQLVSLDAQLKALKGQQNAVPEFYRLSKAAPVNVDVPGANLELLTLADKAGVVVAAFQTSDAKERDGFTAPTFKVTVNGQLDEVYAYMKALRDLVVVRSNRVTARGNLYRVEDFDIHPIDTSTTNLEAALTLSITAPPSVSADESGAAASPEGDGDAPEGNGDAPEGDAPTEESPDEGADG